MSEDLIEIASASSDKNTARLLETFAVNNIDARMDDNKMCKFNTEYLEEVGVMTKDVFTRKSIGEFLIKNGKEERPWNHLTNTNS